MTRTRIGALLVGAMVGVLALAGCSSAASGDSGTGGTELSLVGFAVPKAANDAAQALWGQTADGKGVAWTTSYGASGDQSRAVVAGLAADYVVFSVGSDMTRLVDAGLVAKDWDAGPTKGIVSDSVVVLVVRKGNPKNIKGWDDIIKPGVGIVTPNPGSSGSARWNILAAWSHVVANGGTEAQATDLPRPRSSRAPSHSPAAAATRRPRSRAAPVTCCSPTRTRRSSPARTVRTSTTSSPTPRC